MLDRLISRLIEAWDEMSIEMDQADHEVGALPEEVRDAINRVGEVVDKFRNLEEL